MPDAPKLDIRHAHSARVYNYWLGGKDNFAADRDAAEQAIAANPGIVADVRANREFLVRAVRFLASECGVRQFLDIGAGLPTANNTHEVAQAAAPDARIVYVDNDPCKPGCAHVLGRSGSPAVDLTDRGHRPGARIFLARGIRMGELMTDHEAAVRQVLRVEEFLPYTKEHVSQVLTDPDLISRWLMPNDFKLETGYRFAIDSDPIRQCGLGGTGYCEVLAFDEGRMLRIAWRAANENMSGLDSTVTFTVASEGVGTRLLIEHDGLHPCPYVITGHGSGHRSWTRRVGEVSATVDAWRAAIRRVLEVLNGEVARQEG